MSPVAILRPPPDIFSQAKSNGRSVYSVSPRPGQRGFRSRPLHSFGRRLIHMGRERVDHPIIMPALKSNQIYVPIPFQHNQESTIWLIQ